ncbi:hypothetical protein HNY73_001435 [Argiope bruennichi]|uniref:Uncharacterized protein n=1 Tax=Argiope bruennichi TaxID=94029 RepID=A0A8T0G2E9_ARGBR|nr:hypothetical protein HNY73_001435 [Argiope bruennichi]
MSYPCRQQRPFSIRGSSEISNINHFLEVASSFQKIPFVFTKEGFYFRRRNGKKPSRVLGEDLLAGVEAGALSRFEERFGRLRRCRASGLKSPLHRIFPLHNALLNCSVLCGVIVTVRVEEKKFFNQNSYLLLLSVKKNVLNPSKHLHSGLSD